MSFTDGKPHIATLEDTKAPWSGINNGERFYCRLCGHQFQVGDTYRWICAGSIHRINLLVCQVCDSTDVLDKWEQWWHEWEELAKGKLRYIADKLKDAEKDAGF